MLFPNLKEPEKVEPQDQIQVNENIVENKEMISEIDQTETDPQSSQDKSKVVTTPSTKEGSKKTKAENEKIKRKQIEMEMKKWEREQVRVYSLLL